MGLSTHYHGKLSKPQSLKNLIEEITDICIANKWEFITFEDSFPTNTFSTEPNRETIYGICFTPPKCETVALTFLSNGKLCAFQNLELNKELAHLEDDIYLGYLSVKTQYCGSEVHKIIIRLFDYLNNNYFENFECIDEGQYWETRDEKLLQENFDKSSNLINSFESLLEHLPFEADKTIEDYILRMATIVKKKMDKENNNEDELPKLSLQEENEFKKLKLNLEFGTDFSTNGNMNTPPEIEGQFLDYVYNFENAYQNAKKTTVYKKIGSPEFKPVATLSDAEISSELERIEEIMHQNNLNLDVLANYDDENRLIYNFITEELFLKEIDDMNVPGMVSHFIYEEFYPNHKYDLERETEDFLKIYFNKESDIYKKYQSKDASNHTELNNFRSLFQKFKLKFFDLREITFDEQDAKVIFNIDFWGKIKGSDSKIKYSGNGSMTFKNEYGYWYVKQVTLPINN